MWLILQLLLSVAGLGPKSSRQIGSTANFATYVHAVILLQRHKGRSTSGWAIGAA